jgi:hypothetical protein
MKEFLLTAMYVTYRLRKSTWDRLQLFSGNALSTSLETLLHHSHIAPVLTSLHLKALDRRLLFVFATVEMCFEQHGTKNVLIFEYDAVR